MMNYESKEGLAREVVGRKGFKGNRRWSADRLGNLSRSRR
jgi:hypothetical protein